MSKTNSLHYNLCLDGAKWLKKHHNYGNKIIVVELICIGAENPDVWGTNGFESTLIEVKTSRADFLKDRKKFFRQKQVEKYACGNYRYFLTPRGLVTQSEIPESWGLLEWDNEQIITTKAAQNIPCENHGELAILCSIMRREKVKTGIFNYRKTT